MIILEVSHGEFERKRWAPIGVSPSDEIALEERNREKERRETEGETKLRPE